MDWLPVAGTVLGTLIGSAGAITSQHVTNRTAERSARRARADQVRAERKAAIQEFVEVYQGIERVISSGDDRPGELIHRMWSLRNNLILVASEELYDAVTDLANALGHTYWHGTPDGSEPWEHLGGVRRRFLEAARVEVRPDLPGK
ncbi:MULTISPECIES: hypothetical protein [unclassified Streptomyces]|uniref:hypothetical protein n=1 Tax=unclassified Streptomyces TaxID=2593676 RepID=UPI0028C38115|nr:hypothetical protein [Streptomyces sp. AM8-1-1]WNO70226.1 hypothetical protein RPQ07_00640 [Streptomyces sp. AM8-1-1]